MQPHSMCALALAGYIWNRPECLATKSARASVDFKNKYGEYKSNKYDVRIMSRGEDDKEFDVRVVRDGGGISCTITVRRNSLSEGAEVTMTHSQQHVSGLREVCKLMKKKIANGMHYNSMKYGAFSGDISSSREKVIIRTEIKSRKDIDLVGEVSYEVNLSSVY